MAENKKIWLITGISSGLGKALAEAVLQSGNFVIGTFRKPEQVEAFNQTYARQGFALELDVTDSQQLEEAISVVTERFGRVDVLVNNAGYGIAGAVEETSLAEFRDVFEVNFFGALQLTQSLLPLFRRQRSGHIIQISSHSGFRAFAGFGAYSASKFALEGISEALAAEIAPLGIKLTVVEPGPFRTNFAGTGFRQATRQIEAYENTAGVFRARIAQVHGKQEGDPEKAARAIFQITQQENPPLRLPLGKIAVATLEAKLASVQQDLDNYRELAVASVVTEAV